MKTINTIMVENKAYELKPFAIEPSVSEQELWADFEYDMGKACEPDEQELEEMFAQDMLEQIQKDYQEKMDKEFARIMKKYEVAVLSELYDAKDYILEDAKREYQICMERTNRVFNPADAIVMDLSRAA